MRILILVGLLLLTLSITSSPLNAQDDDLTNCPTDSLEPRMVAGLQGRVLPGDANRLREEPSTDAETLGFIPGEASFYVYAGPVCADDFVWWQVGYDGQIGWTVEGSDEYWIEPLTDTLNISLDDVCFDWSALLGDELIGESIDASEITRRDIEGDLPILSFAREDDIRRAIVLTIYPAQLLPFLVDDELSEDPLFSEILATRPDEVPFPRSVDLFFMPMQMEARAEYVDFENGSGIRYLVHTSQDYTYVTPIFTYVGLTEDNLYLIQFRTFITSIDLNISPEVGEFGELTGNNYRDFIALAADILTEAEPDTFYPDLSEIDAFINSISIGVGACAEGSEDE